jgi:hypothetical protein
MYEDEFGTDWERLDRRELLRRAYALGVADALDRSPTGELDRLESEGDTNYEWSLVELAYQEGRARALELEPAVSDDSRVWERLVSEPTEVVPPTPLDSAFGPPEALDRSIPESRPESSTEKLGLPEFLRRG